MARAMAAATVTGTLLLPTVGNAQPGGVSAACFGRTTMTSVLGMALPMDSGRRSTSSGGKYVARKASVRPYIR